LVCSDYSILLKSFSVGQNSLCSMVYLQQQKHCKDPG
jgi:hypothetical protein